jgi:hypothetical protein
MHCTHYALYSFTVLIHSYTVLILIHYTQVVIGHLDGKRFFTPEQRVAMGFPAEGGRGQLEQK